jgi:hypothetical protein
MTCASACDNVLTPVVPPQTQGAVSELLGVSKACLDTMVSPAPEGLQREAASLVLALAQLPPDVTRANAPLMGLVGDVYRFSTPLPLSVQVRVGGQAFGSLTHAICQRGSLVVTPPQPSTPVIS